MFVSVTCTEIKMSYCFGSPKKHLFSRDDSKVKELHHICCIRHICGGRLRDGDVFYSYCMLLVYMKASWPSSLEEALLTNMNIHFLCPPQSLVLVSKLPYVTFFHSLLKIMAPEYFEKQEPCLEAGKLGFPSGIEWLLAFASDKNPGC